MSDNGKDGGKLPISRRDCLIAGGSAMALAAQPVAAKVLPEGDQRTPPGHQREAPAFRTVNLQK
jgi:hypothetical protein